MGDNGKREGESEVLTQITRITRITQMGLESKNPGGESWPLDR